VISGNRSCLRRMHSLSGCEGRLATQSGPSPAQSVLPPRGAAPPRQALLQLLQQQSTPLS
jgi:hypothetical protein